MNVRAEAALSSADGTREAIILVAERMFGERGIEGVSLREINRQAAQKNKSAVQYHFKTRQGLVAAIYDYRMGHVNAVREHLFSELGDRPSVRELVEVVVLPIVDEIRNARGGSDYVRFLAAVSCHPNNDMRSLGRHRHASALGKVAELLRSRLQDLPDAIFSMRFGLMWVQVIHALAERERLIEYTHSDSLPGEEAFVANLVDMLEGALTAPVDSKTLQNLSRGTRRKQGRDNSSTP